MAVRWSGDDFAVLAAVTDDGEEVTLTGPLAHVTEGETVEVGGAWREHPKHGRQFTVQRVRVAGRADRAQRPAAVPLQQGVLDVLGDQTGDEPGALRPLLHPPAPLRDGLLHQRHHVRLGDPARDQIGEDERTRRVQRLFQVTDGVAGRVGRVGRVVGGAAEGNHAPYCAHS